MGRKSSERIFPGAEFGDLVVVERLPKEYGNNRMTYRVLCRCVCGKTSTPEVSAVLSGVTTSCGCRRLKKMKEYRDKRSAEAPGYGKVILGAAFGRWKVCGEIQRNGKRAKVECLCECGVRGVVLLDGLVQGVSRSCGCLKKETTAKRNSRDAKFDGFSKKFPKTFSRWNSMVARCYNPKQKAYPEYGAKGVVVCRHLKEDPRHLRELIGGWTNALPSLDRFPIHDGNYTCGQCKECLTNGWKKNIRWATRKDQSNNRGDFNVMVSAFGKTMNLSQWEELTGLDGRTIHARLKRGWTHEKAVSTPNRKGCCYRPKS